MSLTNCTDCGKAVSRQANTCMHCGAPVYALQNIKVSRNFAWAVAGIAIVGFSYIFYDPTGYQKPPATPFAQMKVKSFEQRKDIVAKATAGLQTKVVDDIRTIYTTPVALKRGSVLGAYLTVDGNRNAQLYLAPVYVGARPISFKLINVTVNGVMAYEKAVDPKKLKRATVKAGSAESVDFPAEPMDLELLKKVLAAESTVITFHGKGKPREHSLTAEQVAELKMVVDAYDNLKATL
jgi:hypothetical protein